MTEVKATVRSSRVATSTRLKMSRPSWSVPNQWVKFGGCRLIVVSVASGSCGAIEGPKMAQNTISTNRLNDSRVSGFSAMT